MLNLKFFTSSTIRSKIISFVLFVMLVAIAFVVVGMHSSRTLRKVRNVDRMSQRVARDILQTTIIQEKFINNRNGDLLIDYEAIRKDLRAAMAELRTSSVNGDLSKKIDSMLAMINDCDQIFGSIKQSLSSMHSHWEEIRSKFDDILKLLSSMVKVIDSEDVQPMMTGDALDTHRLEIRDVLKEYISIWNQRLMNLQNLTLANSDDFLDALKNISSELALNQKNLTAMIQGINSPELNRSWTEVKAYLPQIDRVETGIFSDWKTNRTLTAKLHEASESVLKTASKINEAVDSQIERDSKSGELFALGLAIALMISLALMGWIIIGSTTRTLSHSVNHLSEAAGQLETEAKRQEGVGHHLADGSSNQAASIEEIVASLEEMSTMTRQNAQHANQANKFMAETDGVISKTNQSMTQLTDSMLAISKASEETSQIIKTIDEIAFQTNLLALNAAVEAARAGQAGAGFAIVAEEVRNLAMRAADASKNTGNLIEDTVRKINEGSEIVQMTGSDFSQVASITGKMEQLVNDITAASEEQAQGIESITKAMGEIDKVVQQNSSNAEESSYAAQQMSSLGQHMKDLVEELATIAGVKIASISMSNYLFGTASAESATKEECAAKVKEAVAMCQKLGREVVFDKINMENGPFAWKDTYVFCYDLNGVMMAHPNPLFVGKSQIDLKDSNGKLFVREFLKIARTTGEGWVTYSWPKVGETEPLPKFTYLHRVPSQDIAFYAGVYE